ncbi:Cathepsin_L [Hexamita inflata]|uniref:Cathepsin L n=1 Tax=Hexamita inflata TaxID=28002 RepID=A0AA86NTH3_9EUKA|nr:Cathepsin L [Hexamita inflata]
MLNIIITYQNLLKLTCDEAYSNFQRQFNKQYSASAQSIFCSNFAILQQLLSSDPSLSIGLVPHMDSINLSLAPAAQENARKSYPTSELCSAYNPLADLHNIHSSIDLRELSLVTKSKSQGSCGSCYSFQTISLLENAMFLDRDHLPPFWSSKINNNNKDFKLSEQFLMSNSFYSSYYCHGGNFVISAYVMGVNGLQNVIQTVELEENIQYEPYKHQNMWEKQLYLKPIIKEEDYYIPFKRFNPAQNWINSPCYDTPVVKIFDDNAEKFDENTIYTIKSYLSHGIAVAFGMKIGGGFNQFIFQLYIGGGFIQKAKCTNFELEHAVTAVGYGKKHGKDVWVIKNSWGSSWGDNGFFFVEIGKDSYCTEHYAYAIIPKYFNISSTEAYPRTKMDRGKSHQLDCEHIAGQYMQTIKCYALALSPGGIAGVAGACLVVVLVICLIIYKKRKQLLFKQRLQLKLNPRVKIVMSKSRVFANSKPTQSQQQETNIL